MAPTSFVRRGVLVTKCVIRNTAVAATRAVMGDTIMSGRGEDHAVDDDAGAAVAQSCPGARRRALSRIAHRLAAARQEPAPAPLCRVLSPRPRPRQRASAVGAEEGRARRHAVLEPPCAPRV